MQVNPTSRAERRFLDTVAIRRQADIARAHGLGQTRALRDDEGGRFRKQHAMGCAKPGCGLCGSARRNPHSSGAARLTRQERSQREIQAHDEQALFGG